MVENNVSVIMVSYNTGPILFRAIESVLKEPDLLELVLVDNGNPESARQMLSKIAEHDPRLKIIANKNTGFASGCNMGAKAAVGRYLLLLNPDCIIPAGSISRVKTELSKSSDYWLAGCCIVNPDGTEQSGSRRNLLTPWVAFVEASRLYILRPNIERINFHHTESYEQVAVVPAISGAFMMIAKARYEELGGIDEDYFFHVEDLDFCFQINKKGGKIIYVPDVKAVHYRSTSDVSEMFVDYNKTRGFVRYFNKNFKGQYFPGAIFILNILIYIRFICRQTYLFIKDIVCLKFLKKLRQKKFLHQQTIRKKLLETNAVIHNDGLLKNLEITEDNQPILIAGASGQVGIAALRRLLAENKKVIAVYHSKVIDYFHPNLIWVQEDLKSELTNLQDLRPRTLIYTPPLWMLPKHIETLAKMGVNRIIAFSSTSIFGKKDSSNAYEQDLVTKLVKAEKDIADACEKTGIKWTIFRPTLIYGIGLDKNITSVRNFIKSFGFFPIHGKGSGMRQPVHCDDLAIAAIEVINNPDTYNKSYNLSGGEKISYWDMISKVSELSFGREKIVSLFFLPALLDFFSTILHKSDINGEIARRMNIDLVFDSTSAKEDFAYAPRTFLAGGKEDLGVN